MSDGYRSRINEIENMHRRYPISFTIILLVLVVGILIGIGLSLISDFSEGLFLELISILITVGIIESINRYREKRNNDRIQRILVSNFGKSALRSEGHKAFFELAIKGLLEGYTTSYFDLSEFACVELTLPRVNFKFFNMDDTKWTNIKYLNSLLHWVSMTNTTIENSIFQKTSLISVDISESYITATEFLSCKIQVYCKESRVNRSSFIDCILNNCCLEECYFEFCNFRNVDFTDSSLLNSEFIGCKFDSNTKLPDGSYYNADLDISQLKKFVNSSDPDFVKVDCSSYLYTGFVPNK